MSSLQSKERKGSERRIDSLDGIRAVFFAGVFLFHAKQSRLGWVGVPVFFVLSGMLITAILRRNRFDTHFWSPFYIKRATRIFPPLLIAFLIAALFVHIPWREVGLYDLFFAANIGEVLHRGASKGLGVLWSLAVEEHFYLFWPFAIRFLNRRQLIRLLIAILVLSPILRAVCTPLFHSFWPIYLLTPFELDDLAIGCLLALLFEDPVVKEWLRVWSDKIFLLSFIVFIFLNRIPSFHREANSAFFNALGYSFMAFGSASLICYVFLQRETVLSKLLSLPVVVFFGEISYGMYLYHYMLLNLTIQVGWRLGFHHFLALIYLSLIPIVLLSWISYRFYENPIRRWGRRKAAKLNPRHQISG